MAKLAIYNGNVLDRHVDLAEREYRIGRGDQNDIVLPDPNKAVSRLHAELRYEGGRFVVSDLNSQNGLWVDGKKVPRVALEPGQPVTVGPYRLVLEPPEAPAAGPLPAPAPAPAEAPKPAAAPEPKPVPKPEPKAAPTKPQARKAPGSRRTKSVVLFGGLFTILIVAGVAIGLFWPSGQPARPAATAIQPEAGEPHQGAGAAAPGLATEGVGAPPEVAEATQTPPPVAAVAPAAPAAKPPASRPATRKPAPSASASDDPSVPERRPGESASAWQARTRQVQNLYKQGTASLRDGDFDAAIERFEAIIREAPGYRDVPTLLDDARRNLRASAQSVYENGLALEKQGDYGGALQAIQRAAQIDPSIEGAGAAVARITARMREAGEEAFKRARQYDALGRKTEAIAQYERALQLLPPDHESRKVAQDRLDALKGDIQ